MRRRGGAGPLGLDELPDPERELFLRIRAQGFPGGRRRRRSRPNGRGIEALNQVVYVGVESISTDVLEAGLLGFSDAFGGFSSLSGALSSFALELVLVHPAGLLGTQRQAGPGARQPCLRAACCAGLEWAHGVAWAVVRAEIELGTVAAATDLSIELYVRAAGHWTRAYI